MTQTFQVPGFCYTSVEGIIGAGKSTAFTNLEKRLAVQLQKEPVEKWASLELFYKEPRKFTYMLQVEILSHYQTLPKSGLVISERSPAASTQVFSKIHLDKGNLTKEQHETLVHYENSFLAQPTSIIYIETPLEIAFERIQKRGRPYESGITRDYLADLEKAYRDFFLKTCIRVIRVDGSLAPVQLAEACLVAFASINPNYIKKP